MKLTLLFENDWIDILYNKELNKNCVYSMCIKTCVLGVICYRYYIHPENSACIKFKDNFVRFKQSRL